MMLVVWVELRLQVERQERRGLHFVPGAWRRACACDDISDNDAHLAVDPGNGVHVCR